MINQIKRCKSDKFGKAKAEGKYRGRRVNALLHQDIRDQLSLGRSYSEIQQKLGCSRAKVVN
ncbi:hypothetical protein [Photobacterium leiognathi]|uniref:hypothetical protein n=1 Tax=Photobacterium leiognathi TaxID=553611 RepID=UPI002981EB87|nr:hypothetical protein [Photobacterium leiognathi]